MSDLYDRLCSAEKGSAELDCEVWSVLTHANYRVDRGACRWYGSGGTWGPTMDHITSDANACFREICRRAWRSDLRSDSTGAYATVETGSRDCSAEAGTEALALCAALVAAVEGE